MPTPPGNSTRPWIIVVIVVGLLAIAIWLLGGRDYSWREDYKPSSKEPYGTYVFHQLLQEVRNGQPHITIEDSMNRILPVDPTGEVDNYIFIGNNFYADLDDTRRILEFVAAGNNAYVFCNNTRNRVCDSVVVSHVELYPTVVSVDEEEIWMEEETVTERPLEETASTSYQITDTTVNLETVSGASVMRVARMYDFEPVHNAWSYFSDSIETVDGLPVEWLGHFDEEYPNFISCPYGKGSIYFHSTPIVFSNFYMVDNKAMNYCRSVVSSMGNGLVYWDEDNRTWDLVYPDFDSQSYQPSEGPIEFILSEASLRWAWYILLAGGFLYLLFGARRRQRVIPTMESMENSSIEYTEVISQMFMKQKDHKKLVMMKMELFKAFLRERYSIKLPAARSDESEILFTQISMKSGIGEAHVKAIFDQNWYLAALTSVDTEDMLSFHNKIEEFYAHCK